MILSRNAVHLVRRGGDEAVGGALRPPKSAQVLGRSQNCATSNSNPVSFPAETGLKPCIPHGVVLHPTYRIRGLPLQGVPPKAECFRIFRICFCTPASQLFEHSPSLTHGDNWQGRPWQGFSLQLMDLSRRSGHLTPPCAAGDTTDRFCFSKPPPHSAVHLAMSTQGVMWQSMGQGMEPHGISRRSSDGHSRPPFEGAVSMLRDCLTVPPPQLTEQTVVFCQGVTWQSRPRTKRLAIVAMRAADGL